MKRIFILSSILTIAICLILTDIANATTPTDGSTLYTITFNDHSGAHRFRVPADSIPNYTPENYAVGTSTFRFLGWDKRVRKNTTDTYTAIYIELNDAPLTYNTTLGIVNGAFSISDSAKIFFSNGNLQYQPSSGTWRFAPSQCNFVGSNNTNISDPTYSGWLDLFGYGTSGWNSGITSYMPNSYSSTSSDYVANDLTGAFAQADWGVHNAISNGGNQPGIWRTLTASEWSYIVSNRPNAYQLHAQAYVNDTLGMVLCPDEFPLNAISTNMSIPADSWSMIEQYGAVFLPYAGTRKGTTYYNHGTGGDYRSAYHSSKLSFYVYNSAYSPSDNTVGPFLFSIGHSVRLVRETYQVTFLDPNGDVLGISYLASQSKPDAPDVTNLEYSDSCMTITFVGWSPNIALVSGNTTYVAQFDTLYNNFQITYNINNESHTLSVPCGTTPSLPTPATWQDDNYEYTFRGWSPSIHAASSNETYIALFDSIPLNYTITWQNYDNTILSIDTLHRGATPSYHGATPTRQGNADMAYVFSGWTPAIVSVIADATYTATYDSVEAYTITSNAEYLLCPGESITLPSGNTITAQTDMAIADTVHFSPLPGLVCDSILNATITLFKTPSISFYEPTIIRGKPIIYMEATTSILNSVSAATDDMSINSFWWEVKKNGTFTTYNNRESYLSSTVTMRFAIRTNCGSIIYLPDAGGAEIEAVLPNPNNTPACDNAVTISMITNTSIVVNASQMRSMGYTFSNNDIRWYRVVGNVDDLDECSFPDLCDDIFVGTGTSLSLNKTVSGTNYYYCLIDVSRSISQNIPCRGILRSNIYRQATIRLRAPEYTATPTEIVNSGIVTVAGLDPEIDYNFRIYDMTGRLISTHNSSGSETFEFKAEGPAGCYRIVINSAEGNQSLAYIITSGM